MKFLAIALGQSSHAREGSHLLEAFAECLYRLSPEVGVRRPVTIWLEISRTQSLYSEGNIRSRIQALGRRFGVSIRDAVAEDLCTALARVAQGAVPPFGGRDLSRAPREALPLSSLEYFCDPTGAHLETRRNVVRMVETLESLGVRDLAGFLRLNPAELGTRFGEVGALAWARVRDPLREVPPWPRWRAPTQISESVELMDADLSPTLENLVFPIRGALDRVMSRLRGRSQRAQVLQLEFNLDKHSLVTMPQRIFDFRFTFPQGGTHGVLSVIRDRLGREFERVPLESAVMGFTLRVLETSPAYGLQKNFFHSHEEQKEALNTLLERLQTRLEGDSVFKCEVQESFIPEHTWRRAAPAAAPSKEVDTSQWPKRPTRVFDPPQPVFRVGRYLLVGAERWEIAAVDGPERIQSGWWDDTVLRDYYLINVEKSKDSTRTQAWVFRSEDHLFLHGVFE